MIANDDNIPPPHDIHPAGYDPMARVVPDPSFVARNPVARNPVARTPVARQS